LEQQRHELASVRPQQRRMDEHESQQQYRLSSCEDLLPVGLSLGNYLMYTYNNLFDKMISFENLWQAARNAQRGKRTKTNTARFNFFMERELFQLQQELRDGTYQPGQYRSFYVYEPKKRLISAAPYRDRVVHHALCRIIEPIFEQRFIYHSYACRVDKGTHRAIDKCQTFIKSNRYVLQSDIQKYFESINHEVLMNILKRWIKDERVLWLAGLIILPQRRKGNPIFSSLHLFPMGYPEKLLFPTKGSRRDGAGSRSSSTWATSFGSGESGTGLPIGNLTSQFFANVYLNELDYFVKFDLREKYYIRYMDDFLIFGNDKEHLSHLKERIGEFLADELKLNLHDKKSTIFPVKDGVNFLGFRIFRNYRLIMKENVRRFIRRMKQKAFEYRNGLVGLTDITNSVRSWVAYAKYGNTYNLRCKILMHLHPVRNDSIV
jgi:retron-type reverse transcriptase